MERNSRTSLAIFILAIIACVWIAMGVAASEEEDGDDEAVNLGLSETTVSDLTDAQSVTFCHGLIDQARQSTHSEGFLRGACMVTAAMTTGFSGYDYHHNHNHGGDGDEAVDTTAICQASLDECLENFIDQYAHDESFDAFCPGAEELGQCDVTVADFNACVGALLAWSLTPIAEFGQLTCDVIAGEAAEKAMEAVFEHMGQIRENPYENGLEVAECRAIRAQCPGVFP